MKEVSARACLWWWMRCARVPVAVEEVRARVPVVVEEAHARVPVVVVEVRARVPVVVEESGVDDPDPSPSAPSAHGGKKRGGSAGCMGGGRSTRRRSSRGTWSWKGGEGA